MKCDIGSDPGSTSTGSLSNPNQLKTIPKDDDESEIMNPGILCAVRAGDKLSLLTRVKSDEKVIQRLLDNQGNTILHIAAASAHVHIVEYVTSKLPILVQKRNLKGETALHVVARAGNLNIVEFLVRFITESLCDDTFIAAKSKNGDTAIHAALKDGHAEVAFYLVSVKHDLSFEKNNDETSPLYLAVKAGNFELVDKMLECSCCPSKLTSLLSGGKSVTHAAMKTNTSALPLLATALVSMAMAFVAGVTLVMSDLPWLSHFVLAIDTVFFLLLMLLIIPYVFTSARQGFLRRIFYFPYFLKLFVVSDGINNMDGWLFISF